MKNLVSIFAGHDANISFYNAEANTYHSIEIERFEKKRYFRLHEDNSPEYQKYILESCRNIAEAEWGIKNDYEAVLICSDGYIQTNPREIFNTEKVTTIATHHQTHALSALYLSPFDKALIVSYDGGGDDGQLTMEACRLAQLKAPDVRVQAEKILLSATNSANIISKGFFQLKYGFALAAADADMKYGVMSRVLEKATTIVPPNLN